MHNQIFLTIVSVLFASTEAGLPQSENGPQIQAIQGDLHTTCISKSGTNEAAIGNVVNDIFTDEPKIKLYMKCILSEIKVIKENGDFHGEIIVQLLPDKIKNEAATIISGCSAQLNDISNLEDKAFVFFKCCYKQNPDIFIFF